MLQGVLSALAVCLDLFFTAAAYGMSGIRIPMRSAWILSGIGAGFLFVSMELARLSGLILPEAWCRYAGVILLSAMGGAMLLKSLVKPAKKQDTLPDLRTIYFDAETADADHSCTLCPKEALLLAVALSVDSLAVGVGLGWQKGSPVLVGVLTLLLGTMGIFCGTKIGVHLHRKRNWNCDWISGALLLMIALLHLM